MKVIGSSSLIALLFAATFVAPVGASEVMAPQYVSSEPSDGEMMDEAPERVEVTFSEPLDPGSELTVTDECGRQVDDGNVDVQATSMSVGIAQKPIGEYQVFYVAKSIAGATGETRGSFDFMVHHGQACGQKKGGNGGHGGHGGDGNGGGGNGGGGSGGHQGGHGGGDNNNSGGSGGHNGHSGSGGGGTDHGSMGDDSGGSTDHSTMGHGQTSGKQGKARHGKGKHGNKHGSGKHGSGKHGGDGAHGLLDILEKNEANDERPLAAGADGVPAPNGQAVLLALALSLLMGVVGGWFLRVSAR